MTCPLATMDDFEARKSVLDRKTELCYQSSSALCAYSTKIQEIQKEMFLLFANDEADHTAAIKALRDARERLSVPSL